MSEQTHLEHLSELVISASRLAEWIYHDVRLDCDDEANERTAVRLREIYVSHGQEVLFGITGWWAIKAYYRLSRAHKLNDLTRPELLPLNVEEITNSNEPEGKKRAVIGAQQFISTMTHNNAPMAEAIFNAAAESGLEDLVALMYSVLLFSIRISNKAYGIGYGHE